MIISALQDLRSGDMHSFGILYDASYERVYKFVYHRTLDTHLTEDIVSMVYMKAMKNIKSLKAQSASEFFSWMLKIAYTTLIDTVRTSREHDDIDEESSLFSFENDIPKDIDNKSKLEEVLSFMSWFSERDRAILTLRIWDELSYEEISSITGESVDNCKKIVSRSLMKITANVSYIFIFSLLLSHVIQH